MTNEMNVLDLMKQSGRTMVHDTLGIVVEEATTERVVLSMPVTERVHQYSGLLHGGVSVVLAESAAAIGAALNTDVSRFTPVGVEINANHIRAVAGGTVRAVATPVYTGRSMAVWSVEIIDDRGRLVCVSRCTMMLKPGGMGGS
jgi:1,4-dihydroxy-2-naphthoyl-CoA hydrolase